MKIQGFEIRFFNFNWNPTRSEVTSMLKREVEEIAGGIYGYSSEMSFAEKCKLVSNNMGYDVFCVDAVRGQSFTFSA